MKVFSRAFTKKEKILIFVFVILLLGMAYYYFVDRNVRDNLAAAKNAVEVNQSELDISTAQLMRLTSMDKELNSYEAGGASRLESYNNVKAELSMLDSILYPTIDYTITLQDPYLEGDLIRRMVAIRFTVRSFSDALTVVKKFNTSELRNIIQDMTYSSSVSRDGYETVSVNMNVIFYETIVGGTPDAGLIMPVQEETAAATE